MPWSTAATSGFPKQVDPLCMTGHIVVAWHRGSWGSPTQPARRDNWQLAKCCGRGIVVAMKTSRVAMRAREPRARGLAVWLALVVILAQAVLFEYAMAGTEAMSGPSSQVAHHEHHDGAKNTQPRPKHSHHADCPFCLALAVTRRRERRPKPGFRRCSPAGRSICRSRPSVLRPSRACACAVSLAASSYRTDA